MRAEENKPTVILRRIRRGAATPPSTFPEGSPQVLIHCFQGVSAGSHDDRLGALNDGRAVCESLRRPYAAGDLLCVLGGSRRSFDNYAVSDVTTTFGANLLAQRGQGLSTGLSWFPCVPSQKA